MTRLSQRIADLTPSQRLLLKRRLQQQPSIGEPIAVVGMACRFAGARDLDAYWRIISEGTDATREIPPSRWDVDAFRAYAHPHFAKGKAWSFRAASRHVTLGPRGDVAWFDEALETKNLGPARGSGVLVFDEDARAWRIAHYTLTITVPNERFKEVKALLEASPAAGAPPTSGN